MSALRQALAIPTLSPSEWQFLRTIADDREDAPWMVMSEPQWRSASALFWSLEVYAQTQYSFKVCAAAHDTLRGGAARSRSARAV